MDKYTTLFTTVLKDDSGQDLIEYALVAGLIAVAAIAAMTAVGSSIASGFTSLGTKIAAALP
jgi:pilus assembly protein Flp/PilA